MILNEKQIRLSTLVFSALLHGALFVQLTNQTASSQAQAPTVATRISLNLLPQPKQHQQVVKDVAPPKPKQKQPEKRKPKKRKVIKQKKEVKPVVREKAVAPKVARDVQRHLSDNYAQVKQRYLSNLLIHIEGYKYYPMTARRRGIEGSIEVSFRLLEDGNISHLTAGNGPSILRRAAKSAVDQALPLPVPPPEIKCPLQISYSMQFQLH